MKIEKKKFNSFTKNQETVRILYIRSSNALRCPAITDNDFYSRHFVSFIAYFYLNSSSCLKTFQGYPYMGVPRLLI